MICDCSRTETHDETADTSSLLADEDVSAHLLELVRAEDSGGGRKVADTGRGLGSVGEPHGGTHLVRDDLGEVGNALGVLGNDLSDETKLNKEDP
jgi:hypothetical protein